MVAPVLLDVNVLIALADEKHVAYSRVHNWFLGLAGRPWATCALTVAGFVRIASNPRFSQPRLETWEAIELLTRLTGWPGHRFWTIDITLGDAVQPFHERLVGHRQVTDAYLLGLVIKNNGHLVTLDRGFEALAGAEFGRYVTVLR
jgi:toxin-antitoxin system PIN domain toxin